MGLSFYSAPDPGAQTNLAPENQITFTFDGRYGGKQIRPVYLRNDDANLWYDQIVIGLSGTGPIGTNYRIIQSDICPSEEYWQRVVTSTSVTLTDPLGSPSFADIVTYITFWVRIETAKGLSAQNNVGVSMTISALEHLVDG
jgi:hypothetical protein